MLQAIWTAWVTFLLNAMMDAYKHEYNSEED